MSDVGVKKDIPVEKNTQNIISEDQQKEWNEKQESLIKSGERNPKSKNGLIYFFVQKYEKDFFSRMCQKRIKRIC